MSAKCCLIIHSTSYSYIKSCAKYIADTLERKYQEDFSIHVVSKVSAVDLKETKYVFIIGELFTEFVRNNRVIYIYLNFSLLYELKTKDGALSLDAKKWIRRKNDLFMSKLHCFDVILDYLPTQTLLMQESLRDYSVEIFPFVINTFDSKSPNVNFVERKYDVCVVGSITERRDKIYDSLSLDNLILSPYKTDSLSTVIQNSKIVINIHAYESGNIELPRIIETLNLGVCLLTEESPSLTKLIDSNCFQEVKYEELRYQCCYLVQNYQASKVYSDTAKNYMKNIYEESCCFSWTKLLDKIEAIYK